MTLLDPIALHLISTHTTSAITSPILGATTRAIMQQHVHSLLNQHLISFNSPAQHFSSAKHNTDNYCILIALLSTQVQLSTVSKRIPFSLICSLVHLLPLSRIGEVNFTPRKDRSPRSLPSLRIITQTASSISFPLISYKQRTTPHSIQKLAMRSQYS